MKPKNSKELLEKTRKVYRREAQDVPALPPGFADRVVLDLVKKPAEKLIVLQWASYAGVAAAAAIALIATLQTKGVDSASEQLAGDPWMDMPMSEQF